MSYYAIYNFLFYKLIGIKPDLKKKDFLQIYQSIIPFLLQDQGQRGTGSPDHSIRVPKRFYVRWENNRDPVFFH